MDREDGRTDAALIAAAARDPEPFTALYDRYARQATGSGLDGYFIARLPDATIGASWAPALSIEARDGAGTVVAQLRDG
jgi:hypothetical protein